MTFTTEAPMKLLPLTVSVKAPAPAVALRGSMEVRTGTGLPTSRLIEAETPPPGAGVRTSIGNEPEA